MLAAMITACGLWSLSWCMGKHLSSAWGVLLPAALLPLLVLLDIQLSSLKLLVALAMLATLCMLFHPRLRHYVLLPSCIALAGGLSALVIALQMPGM